MRNKLVVVFGGSGFLGRYIVDKLAEQGAYLRIPVRHPEQAIFLKTTGLVGQVNPIQVDINKDESVERVLEDADFVVNCIGILYERGRQTFEKVHTEAAKRIAIKAKEAGVKRLVQISAIGADLKSPSKYASSKAMGEKEALKAFPDATVLKPSIMFGEEDDFFNRFAAMAKIMPALPLIGGGITKFQPVYVADVAEAVLKCLAETTKSGNPHAGKTYELGGPKVYTFKELMQYILKETNRERILLPLPYSLASLSGQFLQYLPTPLLTPDQVELLKQDNIVSASSLNFEDLKIQTTAVEAVVPGYLKRYIYHG